MQIHLTLDDVLVLSLDALVGCGASRTNAMPVAESIRDAEADGIRNVGLNYLPHYCDHLLCGKVDGKVRATWHQSAPGVVLCDARNGFAHTAFVHAFDPFVDVTRQNGIGSLAISNSYAAGVIGWYVEKLAEQGLVSLAFANSPAAIAPWGGKSAFFGTNPLAFAIPRRNRNPLIIDQSSSTTAKVNVVEAAKAGEPIPETWALDRDGKPTTDAKAGLEGSMAPSGGYKGVALAMIVDLLAGGLGGPSMSFNAPAIWQHRWRAPRRWTIFLLQLIPMPTYPGLQTGRKRCLRAMLSQDNVRLPGERRHQHRMTARQAGVWLDPDVHEKTKGLLQFRQLGNRTNVDDLRG